jgi:RHS repeat-associated protein
MPHWPVEGAAPTTYTNSVEGMFTSLPFGDSLAMASDTDTDHFAVLDHDYESDTEHAPFRQYNSDQGRFMRPDPYYGSSDFSNPQSMHRYAYAQNDPLSFVEQCGLE